MDQRRIKYLTNNLRLNRDHIHIDDMKKKPHTRPLQLEQMSDLDPFFIPKTNINPEPFQTTIAYLFPDINFMSKYLNPWN